MATPTAVPPHQPVLDATERPYESNPFKLLSPSIEAFQLVAVELLKLIGISILTYLVLGIPAIIGLVSISSTHTASPAGVGLVVLGIILICLSAIYLGYGFTKLMLAAARGHKLAWRESLPKGFGPAWQLAWASGIAAVIIIFGFLFFIVPGIIFAIWYSQVNFVVVDEGLTGMAALRRSKQLISRRMIDMTGIYGMNQVVNLVGNIPFIGSILSIVYAFITMPLSAIRYVQLTQLSDEERGTIPTNVWNYAMLFASIVAIAALILLGLLAAATSTLPTK